MSVHWHMYISIHHIYQGAPIEHVTHVTWLVAQSSVESDYNATCTAGMALENFRMTIHEYLNKDPDVVPE